eukprot:SAG31_NODE_2498_length_5598_cov_2.801600_8_plen_37_part_00
MVSEVTFSFLCNYYSRREIRDFNREIYGTNRESVTM